MKPKPEADIIDIATQQKVDDTGIMKLKTELGIPEDVPSDSALGELLLEQTKIRKTIKYRHEKCYEKRNIKKNKR